MRYVANPKLTLQILWRYTGEQFSVRSSLYLMGPLLDSGVTSAHFKLFGNDYMLAALLTIFVTELQISCRDILVSLGGISSLHVALRSFSFSNLSYTC